MKTLVLSVLGLFSLGNIASCTAYADERPVFVADSRPPFVSELRSSPAILEGEIEFLEPEVATARAKEVDYANVESSQIDYAGVEIEQTNGSYYNSSNMLILERLEALETELFTMKHTALLAEEEKKLTKPTYKLGGRIHLDNWSFLSTDPGINFMEHPPTNPPAAINGTDPENRWAFRRVRLELSGDNPDNIFWRFQIDFADPQSSEFKDVYIGWDGLPLNQKVVLGNQKRPLGLDHWNSSRFNVFMERPFVVESFDSDTRRLGLGFWGHTDDESLFWQYGYYSLENAKDDGDVIGDKIQGCLTGRFGGSPWYEDEANWSHLALAGMVGWPDSSIDPGGATTNVNLARIASRPEARSDRAWIDTGAIPGVSHFQVFGMESMYNKGPFNFTGEAYKGWFDRNQSVGPNLDFMGYYAQVAYFLTGENMTYKRSDGSIQRINPHENVSPWGEDCGGIGAWQIALRYSFLDANDGAGQPNPVWGGQGESVTLGLNWWWSPYARIQFNLIRGQIENRNVGGTLYSGNYTIAGTRYAIDF